VREWTRVIIGALLIGMTTASGALLTALQGQPGIPTKGQALFAGLTGLMAALSEVKARITPPPA